MPAPTTTPRPQLPESPAALSEATWADIAPFYDDLALAPLSQETVADWLATWSRLEELVGEASALATIAYTCDTRDPAKEAAHLRFAADIAPQQEEQHVRLARRLLDVGYDHPDLAVVLRQLRTDARIFRDENVPLVAELQELETQYDKITGGLTVDWDGATKTIPQLQVHLQSRDRKERERAFRLGADAYLVQRDALATLFDRAYELRQQVARNAGFANYQAYIFEEKHRFDYTPGDCARFHDAVEAAVVPAVRRLRTYRRDRLGIESLRPWDLAINPDRAERLAPFATAGEFIDRARQVFDRVHAELGGNFRSMAADGLLDVESRLGKAPGGYCMTLPARGKPFIFMNAVGVPDDVSTLVHEAGHCFHAFASQPLPLIWQRYTGMEAAELASMTMELLASPFLAKPDGYYPAEDVRHAWIEHLEDVLVSLAHIASVDAFQHWIYTSGKGGDRDARDQAWVEIRDRFEAGVNWSGLEQERAARWYRQSHIFTSPFYYIEYGIAQLGALQVWRNSLADYPAAVDQYRAALRMGNTASLPDIYRAAGADLVFDTGTMQELVSLVEDRIAELRAGPSARAA